jgi:hypothetical protein
MSTGRLPGDDPRPDPLAKAVPIAWVTEGMTARNPDSAAGPSSRNFVIQDDKSLVAILQQQDRDLKFFLDC